MNIGYFVNGYTYEFNLYVKMFTFECSFQKYKAFLRAMRFVTFHQFVHSDCNCERSELCLVSNLKICKLQEKICRLPTRDFQTQKFTNFVLRHTHSLFTLLASLANNLAYEVVIKVTILSIISAELCGQNFKMKVKTISLLIFRRNV